MAITFVGSDGAGAVNVTLPAWQPGDFAIAFGYTSGSSTTPGKPSGWTSLLGLSDVATTQAFAIAYRWLQPGDTTTGNWSGVTRLGVSIWRGVNRDEPFDWASSGNQGWGSASSSVTIMASAVNYQTSMVVAFAMGDGSGMAGLATTNLANRTSGGFGGFGIATKTGDLVSNETYTLGTAQKWASMSIGLRDTTAFPFVSDRDTSSGTVTSNSTTWTMTFPSNILAGDLLVAFVAEDGTSGSAFAGDWGTSGLSDNYRGATSANSFYVGHKIANGSETGTFTFTLQNAEQGSWIIYRIPAGTWYGGGIVQLAYSTPYGSGASLNPDPPSLTPSWGALNYLWFAICSVDASRDITAYPSSPDTFTNTGKLVSGGANGASLGFARLEKNATSVDPGTFTIATSDDWLAVTYAVRPKQVIQQFAQAQAQIAGAKSAYAQALSDIKATSRVYSQANVDIKQINQSFAQAQILVAGTYFIPFLDTYTRTVVSGLGTSDNGDTWTLVTGSAANASVNGSSGSLTSSNSSDQSWYLPKTLYYANTGLEFSGIISVDKIPGGTSTVAQLFIGTYTSSSSSTRNFIRIDIDSTTQLSLYAWNGESPVQVAIVVVYTPNDQYNFKCQIFPRYSRGKFWKVGTTEPGWDQTYTSFISANINFPNNVGLYHATNTNVNQPFTWTFDNLKIIQAWPTQSAQAQSKIIARTNVFAQAACLVNGTYFLPFIDTFTRTSSSSWGTSDNGDDWAFVAGTASNFNTNGSVGTIASTSGITQTTQLPKTLISPNQGLEFSGIFSFDKLNSVGKQGWVAIGTRGIGTNAAFYTSGIAIFLDATTIQIGPSNSSVGTGPDSNSAITYTPGDSYNFKVQLLKSSTISTNDGVSKAADVIYKMWKVGNTEPGWTLVADNWYNPFTNPWEISNLRIIYVDGASANSPITFTLDNLQIINAWNTKQAQAQAQIRTAAITPQFSQAMARIGPTKYERTLKKISGLQSFWTLGEPSTAANIGDYQGAISGTVNGTPTFSIAPINPQQLEPGIQLNGSEYLTFGDNYDFPNSTDSYTFILWFKHTGAWSTEETLLDKESSINTGWKFRVANATGFYAIQTVRDNNGQAASVLTPINPSGDIWQFTALTVSTGVPRTFVDNTYGSLGVALASTNTTAPFTVGKRFYDSIFFSGAVGSIAVFNTGVSLDDLQALYTIALTGFTIRPAQANADIKSTTQVYSQAQADIKDIGITIYAQVLADIKATSNAFAQVNAWIEWTPSLYAQAQARIKVTTQVFSQALASISVPIATRQVFSQANVDIKATSQAFSQAQADIKVTSRVYSQAQADIKSTTTVFAQSQADIKAVTTVFAQSQADIKAISRGFAQAQSDIKAISRAFSQANADIKATTNVFAQALASIQGRVYAQAQADIKVTTLVFSQSQADIKAITFVFSQANADIKTTSQAYAQAQAAIRVVNQIYAQANADIKTTSKAYAQAQSDIKVTTQVYAQANSDIKATTTVYSQSQADIKQTSRSFAQAQGTIKVFGFTTYAQANADIKSTSNGFAQGQADIKATSQGYSNANADIRVTSQGYAQGNADIKVTSRGFAQVNADIRATTNAFAQALADIEASPTMFAQAQASISATGQGFAQALVLIYQPQYFLPSADITTNGWVGVVSN